MGKKRIKRIWVGFMSLLLLITSVYTGNLVVRAEDVAGKIAVNFTGNGTLDYVFYDSADVQCYSGGAGIISNDNNSSGSQSFDIPNDAVKMVLKARAAENWQTSSASVTKNNTTLNEVSNGIFGEVGITIDNFTKADGFSINLSFSEQQQQSGLNIPAGSVGFEINNSQNGKVYYSFTGTDGSWVEIGNNGIIASSTIGTNTTIYVKAEPNSEQSVDTTTGANYVEIAGEKANFTASELTGGVASFGYSSVKAHKVHIEFAGGASTANAGDIPISIINAQNGAVKYQVDGGEWKEISGTGSFTLRKSHELDGVENGTTIRFQAVPNQDQSLDTNQGQNWIKIGDQDQADISTEQLLAGTYSIIYNPASIYSMQIKFNGGNDEGGGQPAANAGDIAITVNRAQGTSTAYYRIGDSGDFTKIEGSSVTLSASSELKNAASGTKIYFKAEIDSSQELDRGNQNWYRVDSADTYFNLDELASGTAYLNYDPSKAYDVQIAFDGGNGGGEQQDVSFSCSSMNGNENERVNAVKVWLNEEGGWVDYSSGALNSLVEGDTFKVRITMNEGFTVDKVSLDYESFDHNSRVGYFKESDQPDYDAIIAALLSENGYTVTFQPEADSRNSDGESTLQANSTCLRLQYQTALAYDESVGINLFFQTKDGDNGYGIWTRDDNGADVFVDGVGDSEVIFSFNGNNYGENGDPFDLGYGKENNGESPIQVSYVSAYKGNVGQAVTVTPDTYDYFSAGGYATGTNQNTIHIDDYDGLIDEVYIDVNGDNTFEAGEKLTPEVGEDAFIGTYSYYEKTLDASSSYNILVRKHLSTRVSLKWSYTESGTDFYVDHGDIFIEKVVRGEETLYQAQVNAGGDLVLDEQGVPIAKTDLLGNDYGVTSSAGEVFLECGDEVTIRLIPTYGYQIESATLNGCVELTPNEVVSSFTFTVGGNLHMAGTFVESTDVTDTSGAMTVSDASITDGQNATDSGNLKLTVSDYNGIYGNETTALDLAKGDNAEAKAETIATLDMTLDSMVSKGNGEYWTENISEFYNPIHVNLELNDDSYAEGDTYVVVREHEGELEPLETSYEDGVLSVPTEKFSTYSIVKISAAKEDRPDISLIDISTLKWIGTTFEYNGTAQGPAFSSTLPTGVVLESKTGASNTSAGNYSAVANLKLADGYSKEYYKLVNTSNTAGITVAADGATATVSQAWSISKAAPTITLSNLSETTKAPAGVKATISPEDAAAVVIEYQVEVSANGQTTKQWVTTRPAVAGKYPVRAYLPKGTTNLEAVAEANAVTGTYTLIQYTAPTDNVGKDVNKTDSASNALKANLAEDAKLADKVLTPAEQASGGTVSLTVQDVTKNVSSTDKTLVEGKLGGATLGMYLDVDLTKVVSGLTTPVTETISPVAIRLTLPTSLINTDTTKVRTYQMIRVHDFGAGPVAETLPCDFDAATGILSFETKYFSTYALVYSDASVPASPSTTPAEDTTANAEAENAQIKDAQVKDAVPKTGKAGSTFLWYAVAIISGLGAVYFGKKKRKYTK